MSKGSIEKYNAVDSFVNIKTCRYRFLELNFYDSGYSCCLGFDNGGDTVGTSEPVRRRGRQTPPRSRRSGTLLLSHQSYGYEDVFGNVAADGPVFAGLLNKFSHAVDGLLIAFATWKDVNQY